MGLETFTGKVSDLVETNPPGTDPKSQGDDHIRGIKKTIIGQAIKTQVGQHATASENHFFDGSVPNELTLKRGTPDAPGAELIKALNGALSFPNQGQSLGGNGYVKLPGGMIVQWGVGVASVGGTAVAFPISFPNAALAIATAAQSISANAISVDNISVSDFALFGTTGAQWIAIGY